MRIALVTTILAAVVVLAGCQKSDPATPKLPPAVGRPAVASTDPTQPITTPTPDKPAGSLDTYKSRLGKLMEAAEKGQISRMQEIIKDGANPNDKDEEGQTALHKATAKAQKSVIITLLALGADPCERDSKGITPVMIASEAGLADILGILLVPGNIATLGGDVLKTAGVNLGESFTKRLEGLLGTGVDAADQTGQTALMKAAAKGHINCVRALLTSSFFNPASLAPRDSEGRTALMIAIESGHGDEFVKQLPSMLKGGYRLDMAPLSLRAKDKQGKDALALAKEKKLEEELKILRDWVLVDAAKAGDEAAVKKLLDEGAAADASWPAWSGTALEVSAREGHVAIVKLLMERSKDWSRDRKSKMMRCAGQFSALVAAAGNGHCETIEALLSPDWWPDPAQKLAYIQYVNDVAGFNMPAALQTAQNAKHEPAAQLLEKTIKELQAKAAAPPKK
jgi:ankyrin repeat protein